MIRASENGHSHFWPWEISKFSNYGMFVIVLWTYVFEVTESIDNVYFVVRASCDVIIVTPKSFQNDCKGRFTSRIINFWTLFPIFFQSTHLKHSEPMFSRPTIRLAMFILQFEQVLWRLPWQGGGILFLCHFCQVSNRFVKNLHQNYTWDHNMASYLVTIKNTFTNHSKKFQLTNLV